MDETWDLDVPPLPERSRLYHLKPIGVGTPHVESLTSYISRLVEAHCIIPKVLVVNEILPLLIQSDESKPPLLSSYAAWRRNIQNLNGTGLVARSAASALEKLTKRDNLHDLTMLTWANVISKYELLRDTQAWCPLCYEEWKKSRKIIYSPLLWSLKVVKICLIHQQPLQERCPSPQCQKSLPIFDTVIRLGYCPYCNYWLGSPTVANSSCAEAIAKEEFEQAYWNVIAIGELLEIAPRLSAPLQKEDLALAISLLINLLPIKKLHHCHTCLI